MSVGDHGFVDFAHVVCPETGLTAWETALEALNARDHLGIESTVDLDAPVSVRRAALIEDVRAATGVLAAELHSRLAAAGSFDAARRARLAHRATMRSDSFALYTALALHVIDDDEGRRRRPTGP